MAAWVASTLCILPDTVCPCPSTGQCVDLVSPSRNISMHSLFDIASGWPPVDSMWCAIQYWCNHSIVYALRLMYNY